jgi:hypothetical protein
MVDFLMPDRGDYPAWICFDCGKLYGRARSGVSTYHLGDRCGWCDREIATTQPRDWGYPPAPDKRNA